MVAASAVTAEPQKRLAGWHDDGCDQGPEGEAKGPEGDGRAVGTRP